MLTRSILKGDNKGSAKGQEGSARKDGVQHDHNAHVSKLAYLFLKQTCACLWSCWHLDYTLVTFKLSDLFY